MLTIDTKVPWTPFVTAFNYGSNYDINGYTAHVLAEVVYWYGLYLFNIMLNGMGSLTLNVVEKSSGILNLVLLSVAQGSD